MQAFANCQQTFGADHVVDFVWNTKNYYFQSMEFELKFKSWYKNYKLKVEVIGTSKTHEKIKVSGKTRFIVLENDRPFFVARGLRHRRWDWKLIEGESIHVRYFIEDLISALEKYLRNH